jgi:hypothetical protein
VTDPLTAQFHSTFSSFPVRVRTTDGVTRIPPLGCATSLPNPFPVDVTGNGRRKTDIDPVQDCINRSRALIAYFDAQTRGGETR